MPLVVSRWSVTSSIPNGLSSCYDTTATCYYPTNATLSLMPTETSITSWNQVSDGSGAGVGRLTQDKGDMWFCDNWGWHQRRWKRTLDGARLSVWRLTSSAERSMCGPHHRQTWNVWRLVLNWKNDVWLLRDVKQWFVRGMEQVMWWFCTKFSWTFGQWPHH